MKSQIYGFKIGQCENQEEYEALVKENEALYAGWREHVLPMLRANDLNARKIAAGCGISQSSAALFSRKIPAKRETVIMMAMMMHLSVAETNELLTRWARFQRLYAKHPCDAIWIYLLQKGGSDEPADLFDEYYAVFQEIQRQYLASTPPSSHRFATRIAFDAITCSAGEHAAGENSEKTSAQQDTSFRALMEKLMPSFEDAYQGLLRYLKEFFVDIEDVEDNQVGLNGAVEKHPKKRLTPNILFSDKPGVLDRYYRKMRDLENEHTLPSRLFLIALGIHLSMNTDQLRIPRRSATRIDAVLEGRISQIPRSAPRTDWKEPSSFIWKSCTASSPPFFIRIHLKWIRWTSSCRSIPPRTPAAHTSLLRKSCLTLTTFPRNA